MFTWEDLAGPMERRQAAVPELRASAVGRSGCAQVDPQHPAGRGRVTRYGGIRKKETMTIAELIAELQKFSDHDREVRLEVIEDGAAVGQSGIATAVGQDLGSRAIVIEAS